MLNPHKHPSDEMLVAYLEAFLEDAEHQAIADHVRGCDRCVELLAVVQSRLELGPQIATPVPAAVLARAAGLQVVTGGAERTTTPAAAPSFWKRAKARLAPLFEMPVLAPASFAFGVLLMLAVQRGADVPGQPQSLMRSVPAQSAAVVTAREALVRSAPQPHAPVVFRLERGQRLDVVDGEGEWLRVTLAGGASGWVERQALE